MFIMVGRSSYVKGILSVVTILACISFVGVLFSPMSVHSYLPTSSRMRDQEHVENKSSGDQSNRTYDKVIPVTMTNTRKSSVSDALKQSLGGGEVERIESSLLKDNRTSDTVRPEQVSVPTTWFNALLFHRNGAMGHADSAKLRFEMKMKLWGKQPLGDPVVYDRRNIPPELLRLAPNVFNLFPNESDFLPEYRSPCWRSHIQQLQCLPFFYIGGFPKCGTTDLWGKLIQHPDIVWTTKEPHWWTTTPIRNVAVYFNHQTNVIMEMDKTRRKDLVTCDASALLFQDNKQLITRMPGHLRESLRYLTADIVRAVMPNTKIVGIIRNPTDRAYSSYMYFDGLWKHHKSPRDFHKRVVRAIEEFYNCTDHHSLYFCANYKIQPHVNSGCYVYFIREYLERYPREQCYFLRTEDWARDHPRYMKEIYTFLDLDPLSDEKRKHISSGKNMNSRKAADVTIGPMFPETRKLLDEFFRPCNEELARLLRDDKYLWRDTN